MNRRPILPALLVLALFATAIARARRPEPSAAERLAAGAQAFLDALPPELREKASIPFEDPERANWHYVPRDRRGVSLAEMPDAARAAAHATMRAVLSTSGYLKATSIWRLEEVLFALESRPDRPATHRDPQRYWFSVFGTPGGERWGWRLEGHHLSLNLSVVDGTLRATPFFLGANPGVVRQGPHAGLSVLAEESRRGRELLESLSEEERERATLSDTAPPDILLVPGRDGGFEETQEEAQGLAAVEMSEESRRRLLALVETFLDNLRADCVDERRARVQERFDDLRFAWMGSHEAGRPHYWRVAGAGFTLEFDDTQNGANHPHAAWREDEGDFALDLLAEHRREHHPR